MSQRQTIHDSTRVLNWKEESIQSISALHRLSWAIKGQLSLKMILRLYMDYILKIPMIEPIFIKIGHQIKILEHFIIIQEISPFKTWIFIDISIILICIFISRYEYSCQLVCLILRSAWQRPIWFLLYYFNSLCLGLKIKGLYDLKFLKILKCLGANWVISVIKIDFMRSPHYRSLNSVNWANGQWQ